MSVTTLLVLAPCQLPGLRQPLFPDRIPVWSVPDTKRIVAVVAAFAVAGLLLFMDRVYRDKKIPGLQLALRTCGIFMILAGIFGTELLFLLFRTPVNRIRFVDTGLDPTWLTGRAIVVLLFAAFPGLMIFWTNLIRQGSAVAVALAGGRMSVAVPLHRVVCYHRAGREPVGRVGVQRSGDVPSHFGVSLPVSADVRDSCMAVFNHYYHGCDCRIAAESGEE